MTLCHGLLLYGQCLWSSLFYILSIRSKRPVEWPMHGDPNHMVLLAAWATRDRTGLGCFKMTNSLCTSGHWCCRSSFKNAQTLSGRVTVRRDYMDLNYDGMIRIYYVLIYIYIFIAYFLSISTILQAITF